MFFLLIDCNNFYVSCERLFNPNLNNKPVIILSNNDGCVISRSNEAKELGIKMAEPYFKIEKLCRDNKITALSSNYQLYGDISSRIMDTLKDLLKNIEIYSIDEAFAAIKANPTIEPITDIIKQVAYVRNIIDKWIGIPISIGIGKTKTLAKLANHIAKKNGLEVFALTDDLTIEHQLKNIDVAEVWGVGKKNTAKLNELNIISAYDLAKTPSKIIRQKFGVVGERIVLELNGIRCFELEENQKSKKNIVTSKSFGTKLKDLAPIEEALANHAYNACYKLRKQRFKARGVCVFLKTSRFEDAKEYYSNSKVVWFIDPTDDARIVVKEALIILKAMHKQGYNYNKVGIALLELVDITYAQGNLLLNSFTSQKMNPLMSLLDKLNNKMGRGTIKLASQGVKNKDLGWKMRALFKSPRYTTSWQELVTISI